jgi:hypothetical protein
MITPRQFEDQVNVYQGAVGGGAHPGSGLPAICESGRISAGLILERGFPDARPHARSSFRIGRHDGGNLVQVFGVS